MKRAEIKRLPVLLLCLAMLMSLPLTAKAEEAENEGFRASSQEEFDSIIEQFMADYRLGEDYLSVGFIFTGTGEEYYFNPDYELYSASMYKVPLLMTVEKKILEGEIDPDTKILNYSLDWLEEQILVNSNNDCAHWILSWFWDHDSDARHEWPELAGMKQEDFGSDFYDCSRFTARFMTRLMYNLWETPENYGRVLGFLKLAQPDHWFRYRLEGKYEIAQKYGAYELVKHTSGIIYTENPIILTVMTTSCPDSDARIGDLAERMAAYSEEMTARLNAHLEQVELERQEAERLRQEEEAAARRAEEERVRAELEAAEAEAEAEALRLAEEAAARKRTITVSCAAAVLAAGAGTYAVINKRKKNKGDNKNENDS